MTFLVTDTAGHIALGLLPLTASSSQQYPEGEEPIRVQIYRFNPTQGASVALYTQPLPGRLELLGVVRVTLRAPGAGFPVRTLGGSTEEAEGLWGRAVSLVAPGAAASIIRH